uniref:restriction endonuclease subunit S n=1 Tax=Rheinheimera sp. TaxID=1869214 RepID=UPI0040476A01
MNGWVTRTLGEVIHKARNIDPRKKPDENFFYVDVSGVSNKTLEITEVTELLGKDAPSRARRLIQEGDVIFATIRPTLRRIAIVPSELDGEVCSTGYFVFQPNDELYNKFLYYFLQSDTFMFEMEKLQTGASYPAVNDSQVKATLISYPAIPEQKRIVAILDQAFSDIDQARATAETNLKNARELFDSYLQQVFSQRGEDWITTNLKDITSKIGSGSTPKGGQESYKKEGISLIRSMNVHDRRFKEKDLAFIDDEQAKKLSNVEVIANDVLLNITGASVARSCVVPESCLPARVNQHVSIIRVKEKAILPELLCYLLTSKYYKDMLLGIGESGSTRQAITKAQIEEFEISFPESLESQEELKNQISELENDILRLKYIYHQKLSCLDELKKSILQKAFTGELTKSKGIAA